MIISHAAFVWITTILVFLAPAQPQNSRSNTEDPVMIEPTNEATILTNDRTVPTKPNPDAPTTRTVDDAAMQVRVSGQGPPLVLVGGGLTGWSSWEPHVAHLESTRTVASMQLLSVHYGLENRPLPAGYGVPTETAAFARALDELAWRDALDVVAWSYGAHVALDFALDHPGRIRTLTLIEPPALWVLDDKGRGDTDVEAIRSIDVDGPISEAVLEQFVRAVDIAPPDTDPKKLPQWASWLKHRRSLRNVAAPLDFDDDLARLSTLHRPVLLVTGTGTAPFLRRIHDTLAVRLPRVRTVEMPGGHAPHIVSMDRFLAELQDFQAAEYATSADGTSIGFTRRGNGPAILFVHGTTADRNSWTRISKHLEEGLTVHVMDRRGRGLSGDAAEYDLAREAEDVAAVVEAIGEPVIVFGHSFGGLIALEASRLTDHVKRLILYEPSLPSGTAGYAEHDLQRIRDLIGGGDLASAMEYFLRRIALISDDDLETYRQTPLWQARLPLIRTVAREMRGVESYVFDPSRFAMMDIPVALFLGSDSPSVYRDSVETLHAALPQSDVVTLEGQQHLAHHAAPERLAGEILRWVQ